MRKIVNPSITATLSRSAFTALLFVTMAAATLHLGAATAQAAQAVLSWSAPTTNTDGTPIKSLSGYKVFLGTASGNYSQNVNVGNVNSYTVANLTDGTTYYFAVTAYDASGNASGYSNQATYTTLSAPPQTSLYTLTASAGTGGTITPSGATVVSTGASQSYTVTPNTGYYLASLLVDGTSVASNVAGGAPYSYTFSSVSASHTIAATFGVRSYHITATAGTNGSATPADTWVVYQGSQAMSFTPASGYQVSNVTVDGTSLGAVSSYSFNNVSADHTLSVTFGVATPKYTITSSAGANGTITPTATVNGGTSPAFTVTPNTGYYVIGVVVDGTTVASNIPSGGYTYTFSNLAANHTISATFGIRYYNLAATAGTGGSVTPGNSWVLYNSTQTVTVTPNSGYKIADVKVDGTSVGAVSSYTFKGISDSHTVQATFM
jgi:hypothetical protein